MPKVKTHPLAEIISKKLFGISTVPKEEQERMVARAIKAAVKFHDDIMQDYRSDCDYTEFMDGKIINITVIAEDGKSVNAYEKEILIETVTSLTNSGNIEDVNAPTDYQIELHGNEIVFSINQDDYKVVYEQFKLLHR